MMGDGPANHLILRGDGLPSLGWRQDGRRIDHGAVLQQNGARGLETDHFNGQTATFFRREGKRNGLHATDVCHVGSCFVHAHHER